MDRTIPRDSPAISLCQSRLQSAPNRTPRGDGFRTTPEAPQLCRSKTAERRKTCVAVESECATLRTQSTTPQGEHSWFGFPITLGIDAPFSVDDIMTALGDVGIETRPIICGNIARQPGLKLYPHRTQGDLSHASAVMERGFLLRQSSRYRSCGTGPYSRRD